jgi:hypothetical protein
MDTQTKTIKTFLTLITLLVVVAGITTVVIGFAYKTETSKIKNDVTVVNKDYTESFKDFPIGLIDKKDILNVVESYSAVKNGDKTQYTFKYNTLKTVDQNIYHFETFTRTGGWRQSYVALDKDKSYYSISGSKGTMFVSIVINKFNEGKGSVVDVTFIK